MSFKRAALLTIFLSAQQAIFAQAAATAGPLDPSQNIIEIDASQSAPAVEIGFLHLGGRSSTGRDLEINNRYLTLDGKPILPVMGEFHYSRFPPQYWEEEILKMKAAGINIISTYIFWIHHEEIEGQFDWSGQRDLRRFVQLCAKHDMYVYLRPGPWAHGEVRNGGFPDWLMKNPKVRTNDPDYLTHVARFDEEISKQLQGLLWKDGGPVLGVQIENEYGQHGPGKGADHILKLKELLIAAGIDVPLYSVTGWPSLDFPPHEVIPVTGGYPDGFWFGSRTNLPPDISYMFNFNREFGDLGAVTPKQTSTSTFDLRHDPYFAAERGGGMASAYHRRPLIDADDITALTLTGIGSGINLYGYYMFQGGANPRGKISTLQESQATGYVNDLPVFNYDFEAPLGEYGQVRESYRKTRILHLFLHSFGSDLAQMRAVGPRQVPKDAADNSIPRVAVRARGDSGFIFVNNYVRQLPMPPRPHFQVRLKLPNSQLVIPAKPLTIPANSYLCWPVNLPMDGMRLEYSTAQLLTRITTATETTFVFFAIPDISAEFSFAANSIQSLHAPGQTVVHDGSFIRIEHMKPGIDTSVQAVSQSGSHIRVLLLTEAQAESLTVPRINGQDHLVISPSDVFANGDQLHIRSTELQSLDIKTFPALGTTSTNKAKMTVTKDGIWTNYNFARAAAPISWTWKKTRDAQPVEPVKIGPFEEWRGGGVAQLPDESAFDKAAEWTIELSQPLPAGVTDLFLTADYTGDIGRLYLGDTFVDDNFFNGRPWQIGLKRYLSTALHTSLRIEILPLLKNSPIYLDPRIRGSLPDRDQTAELRLTLKPEYEIILILQERAALSK